MTKGTPSMGKRGSKKTHILSREAQGLCLLWLRGHRQDETLQLGEAALNCTFLGGQGR